MLRFKKPLLFVGAVLVLMFTVVAVSQGGKKKKKKLPPQPFIANEAPPQERTVHILDKNLKVRTVKEKDPFKPYFIAVSLDNRQEEQDADLATEVAAVFEKLKPSNGAREDFYGYLHDEDSELTWRGWTINIKKVEHTASGWKAQVVVNPQVKHRSMAHIMFHHPYVEVYSFTNNRLKLEKSYPYPKSGMVIAKP